MSTVSRRGFLGSALGKRHSAGSDSRSRRTAGDAAEARHDVLVLNDQMNWPETTRSLARQAVEAGRGFVLLHHSLGGNQDWPWWYEEVTGGLLLLNGQNAKKPSVVSAAAKLDVRPTGRHPILRNVTPFTLTNEDVYKQMW